MIKKITILSSVRRVVTIALTAVMVLTPLLAEGASLAGEAFQKFNSLRSSGAKDDAIYASIHDCFKIAMSQLENSQPASEPYNEAKTILLEIYPFLRSGAFYFSSKNNQNNALVFACDYLDISVNKAFSDMAFEKDDQYAKLAYFAASGVYNRGDKKKAIPYLKAYIASGQQTNRKNVFNFLAKACIDVGDRSGANEALQQAITSFPNDYQLLSMAINNAIEAGDYNALQHYVDKAKTIRPNDLTLLNIQGKLYEDTQQFQQALNTYTQLSKLKPNNLQVSKHIALNYYNLGALNYNKAQLEGNTATGKKLTKQSEEFFKAASQTLEDVVKSDPTAVKYLQALATAYSCLGNTIELQNANKRLASVGMKGIEENAIPQLLSFGEGSQASQGNGYSFSGGNSPSPGYTAASNTPSASSGGGTFSSAADAEPQKYSEFAKQYVEKKLEEWQAKDPYETLAEYQERVTEQSRDAKIKELLSEAEGRYIAENTKGLKFNNMTLKPYDAENGVFLIESPYGELVVGVPRDNNEAKVFESGWNGMQFQNPEFYINDDRLLLSSLTFVTPTGKRYRFDADKSLNYTETVVDVSFGNLNDAMFAHADTGKASQVKKNTQKVQMGTPQSDVDTDIPTTKAVNDKTFAVVIANENYNLVAPVPMANNDGEVFAKYCQQALGLPERNVRLYKDASFGTMLRAMRDIKEIADAFAGDIQVIFYYAGHGIPNESTKDAFLLPIDADGTTTDGCYSLKRLYGELADLKAKNTLVFLDACFSGSNRDGDMLASARGVKLRPKTEDPMGNMVIFSAASGDETAFPYTEKGHGLFTYYLLKKIQEEKGNVELGELAEYVKTNVRQQSVVVNRKSQTPTVTPSAQITSTWNKIKLGKKE